MWRSQARSCLRCRWTRLDPEKHTLCITSSCLMTLKSAWPSQVLLCALLRRTKPKSADLIVQTVGVCSSIQEPVTAKYPSMFEACHASHVRLTWPLTMSLCQNCQCQLITCKVRRLIVKHLRRSKRCCLKRSITFCQVSLRVGKVMPFVAREARLIMIWNDGCCNAWARIV